MNSLRPEHNGRHFADDVFNYIALNEDGWMSNKLLSKCVSAGSNRQTIHYSDVIMSALEFQITSVAIVWSTICSGADQRKHQSSASLAAVRGIHRWPVESPHKGPVTREMFSFDDVIMQRWYMYALCLTPSRHQARACNHDDQVSDIMRRMKIYFCVQHEPGDHPGYLQHFNQQRSFKRIFHAYLCTLFWRQMRFDLPHNCLHKPLNQHQYRLWHFAPWWHNNASVTVTWCRFSILLLWCCICLWRIYDVYALRHRDTKLRQWWLVACSASSQWRNHW